MHYSPYVYKTIDSNLTEKIWDYTIQVCNKVIKQYLTKLPRKILKASLCIVRLTNIVATTMDTNNLSSFITTQQILVYNCGMYLHSNQYNEFQATRCWTIPDQNDLDLNSMPDE